MSWYSDRETFDEWDDPYCERIRCEGGESYEQCRRCMARVYGNAADEEEEEMPEHTCEFCYYEHFDGKAYPCSMCVCGEEREDMFQPKNRRTDQ